MHFGLCEAREVEVPVAVSSFSELERMGRSSGDDPQTRYALNISFGDEPIEGINEGINDRLLRLVCNHPGRCAPFFIAALTSSRATVERALAALVKAGRIEHRGSKKTCGILSLR